MPMRTCGCRFLFIRSRVQRGEGVGGLALVSLKIISHLTSKIHGAWMHTEKTGRNRIPQHYLNTQYLHFFMEDESAVGCWMTRMV